MSACQVCVCGVFKARGRASSTRMVEPHFATAQLGASRSVSPERLRMECRFLEARKRGSEHWYLSAKRAEGRVR